MLAITCLATGAYMLSRNLDMTHDAVAATSGSTVYSVSCNAVTQVAYVPSTISAAIGWTANITTLPVCAATAAVGGDVANDTADPTASCNLYAGGNHINVAFISPAMKVGGLQCQTAVAGVGIAANATADAGANLEIYIDDSAAVQGVPDTTDVDKTAPKVLFGSGGVVKGTDLADGSDFDALINGEVQFGKTTGTAASGADGTSKTFMRIDHTNNTTTPSETIVFTFTAAGA